MFPNRMIILLFSGRNPQGEFQASTFGGPDLESGFDILTSLVNEGWQLSKVELVNGSQKTISLPVEIFDGKSFREPLKNLKQEWEDILSLPH
ncbi:hypothetical protein [Spirosoma flavum]|uniref:DUF4177 domain-containing protein n=1 Tax=Spirosoma flavum TaxID=2048557 RepID=A0ABW6AV12_9BACT